MLRAQKIKLAMDDPNKATPIPPFPVRMSSMIENPHAGTRYTGGTGDERTATAPVGSSLRRRVSSRGH